MPNHQERRSSDRLWSWSLSIEHDHWRVYDMEPDACTFGTYPTAQEAIDGLRQAAQSAVYDAERAKSTAVAALDREIERRQALADQIVAATATDQPLSADHDDGTDAPLAEQDDA